jgi:hypothetical protein
MMVSLATDDLLSSFPTYKHAEDFKAFLEKYCALTMQTGSVLKFFGIRIVQSDIAISMDQSEFIFDLLVSYFGKDIDKVKTLTTPMRYDTEYEKELFDAIPLTKEELVTYAIQYKGGYRHHTGNFNFAATITRPDIKYATQRLSEYNHAPSDLSFQSVARMYRYLAYDPHRPLVYSRNKPMSSITTLSYEITPGINNTLEISNAPVAFADAELARCLKTRASYLCVIICLYGTMIQMKVMKTDSVMMHTTDSEMKAKFLGSRLLLPIRQVINFVLPALQDPSPLYGDNAAVNAIVIGGRMTPRSRHIDIPIAFLHEQHHKSFQDFLIKTDCMMADIGTKPLPPILHKRFKYWCTGQQFLPPKGHPHYDDLTMQYYEMSFDKILKILRS